jgi:hypothetical protein
VISLLHRLSSYPRRDDRSDKSDPRVRTTVIAKWRPWVYYLVSTVRRDGSSHLARLMSSLETGISFDRAPNQPEKFITQVVRCNRFGIAKSWDHPLHEVQYDAIEEARQGHEKALAMFAVGGTPKV